MSTLTNLLTQLQINSTLFVMLGLFVATYFILSQLALKKLSSHIVERDQRIDGREHEVHHIREKLTDNNRQLNEALKNAQLEASATFHAIKQKAVEEQRGVLNQAREKSSTELKSVRANVAEQMNGEMKKLEGEIPKLARLILDQILDVKSSAKASSAAVRTEV